MTANQILIIQVHRKEGKMKEGRIGKKEEQEKQTKEGRTGRKEEQSKKT